MKILIIRHADPDYSKDSLTPAGWKEAKLLSVRLAKEKIDAFYVSPLGRAKDTASLTLRRMHRKAKVLPWLAEFEPRIARPDRGGTPSITWDWLPADWTAEPAFFDKDLWYTNAIMQEGHVGEAYTRICASFDALLALHGYERSGALYKAVRANDDTLVLFCHFGLECVLLSHLLNMSPMLLWHGSCAAPSSVTTLVTEERREGSAYFRMLSFADTSHLYVKGVAPAFSARFCELYSNKNERHD